MRTRQAPQAHLNLSATGISALLLLGFCCGTALASTDASEPCPEMGEPCSEMRDYDESSLREILDSDEITSSAIRVVESKSSVAATAVANTRSNAPVAEHEKVADSENSADRSAPVAEITTHLPGVPETDLPRFRRQMFRTDI